MSDIVDFARKIETYESDTFSASGSGISELEAMETAEQILEWWIESHLDGVVIKEALDEVRA